VPISNREPLLESRDIGCTGLRHQVVIFQIDSARVYIMPSDDQAGWRCHSLVPFLSQDSTKVGWVSIVRHAKRPTSACRGESKGLIGQKY
jgi:hypothetical protein